MSDTATKVGHTAGPWDYDIILDICCDSEDLSEHWKDNGAVAEANARLIASAPDLLAALKAALAELDTYWQGDYVGRPLAQRISSAIQLAEGGKP